MVEPVLSAFVVGNASAEIDIVGIFWFAVISSMLVEFSWLAVLLGALDVGFTRENCLKTWDKEELAVWWGNMGTACWMLDAKFEFVLICDEVIEIICELLLPDAFAFANSDLTVWFDELTPEDDWGLVKFAIVEAKWGLAWIVAVVPDTANLKRNNALITKIQICQSSVTNFNNVFIYKARHASFLIC